jgi:SprT protein
MDAQATLRTQLGRIWTPEKPLPTRPVLRELTRCCSHHWGAEALLKKASVVYNPRLRTTLGRAILQAMRVELNPHLLNDHPGELVPTLAHELAHLVVYRRHGRVAPHGQQFRHLMAQVGLSAQATHELNVEHVRRRRRRKYLYLHRCSDCGYSFVARRPRRNCYCKACGPEMSWDVFRAPNTAAGQTLLKRLGG